MVVTALAGLKGDLSGHYYSLGDMTEKEQQQLIDVSFIMLHHIRITSCLAVLRLYYSSSPSLHETGLMPGGSGKAHLKAVSAAFLS